MRISKQNAKIVAIKLAEKKKKLMVDARQKLSKFVTDAYVSQTPKEVLKCFKTNSEWFATETSIRLDGNGFNWYYVECTAPVIKNNRSCARLNLDDKNLVTSISKLDNDYKKEKKEYDSLVNELEVAIFSLRTIAKIIEQFPEAEKYLPTSTTTSLAINFSCLRNKIENKPC